MNTKSEKEISMMKKAGELLASCHKEIAKMIKPGITTLEIDLFVEDYLKNMGLHQNKKDIEVIPLLLVHL